MAKEKINWIGNDVEDDYTCKINGFCLRAEQMEKSVWWWAVYSPDGEQIDSWDAKEWPETKEQALKLAEYYYLSLRETNPV